MGMLLSPKLYKANDHLYMHWCPGCKSRHGVSVGVPNHSGAQWSYNGNPERPTFSPSIHIKVGEQEEGKEGPNDPWIYKTSCHYFIRDGMIEFCSDSNHPLSGQTVELPDFPQHTRF